MGEAGRPVEFENEGETIRWMLQALIVLGLLVVSPTVLPAADTARAAFADDFETGKPWWPNPSVKTSLVIVEGVAGRSMRVTGREDRGDWQYCVGPRFPLKGGQRYRLTGRLLVKGVSRPRSPYFRVTLTSAANTQQVRNVSTRHYRLWEGGWQTLSGQFTCPQGVDTGQVSLDKGDGAPIEVEAYVDQVEVVEIDAFEDPKYVPPPTARRGHPRLFFTEADIAGLKAKAQSRIGTPYFERLRAVADRALARPRVNPSENWRSRQILDIVPPCALAHVLTSERKYARRAVEEMLAATAWPDWVQNVNRGRYSSDLATGETCVAVATGYDWLYDVLTEAERTQIRNALVRFGMAPYLTSIREGRNWAGWQPNNWTAVVNGGAGVGALAIYDESPEAAAALAYAARDIERYPHSWCYGRDGGYNEGVMYWSYGTYYLSLFASAMRSATGRDTGLMALEPVRTSGWFPIYFTAPDGIIANFCDAYDTDWSTGYGVSFAGLLASHCDGPVLAADRRAYLWLADHGGQPGGWGASAFAFLWRPEEAAPDEPPTLSKARHFRDVGWAVLRSEPVYRPKVYLAFKSGDLGANHTNYDLNSFLLVAHGQRLTHDPGYGVLETRQHSSVLVDSKGQEPRSRGRIVHVEERKGYSYLLGDASEAYAGALKRFRRHVVFVGDGHVIVVLDELAAPRPATFTWLVNTKNAVDVAAGASEATIRAGKAELAIRSLLPADARLKVRDGRDRMLEISNAAPDQTVHFLTVLAPQAAGERTLSASVDREEGTWTVRARVGETKDLVRFRVDKTGECRLLDVNGEHWTPGVTGNGP